MASGPPENRGSDPGPDKGLDGRQRRQLITLGMLVVVAIVVLAFILENRERVEISFIVFTARTSLIWLIVLSLVAGGIVGHLIERMIRRRFRKKPE